METKITKLKGTSKEEVATDTIEEETVANTMPLEESKENPEDVCLWGVPLLDTKGDERTNVILLKFLRVKDFNVDEACTVLVNTVKWHQSFLATTIREKKLQCNLDDYFYKQGKDRDGHPVCYNIWGAFHDNPDLFEKKKPIEIALEQVLHFLLSFVYTKPFSTASVFCTVTLNSQPLEPNVFPLHSRTLDMDNVIVEQHARNELIQKYTILQPDLDTITNCFCITVTICVLKETNSANEF